MKTKEIPIFFSTDDNYIPYLDVAIASLVANASKEYNYRIVVLNTGLKDENIVKVKLNERPGFVIDFINFSFVNFFVFNVADCCVVIGCALFVLYLLIDMIKGGREEKSDA